MAIIVRDLIRSLRLRTFFRIYYFERHI
jgi:hypothetical protein